MSEFFFFSSIDGGEGGNILMENSIREGLKKNKKMLIWPKAEHWIKKIKFHNFFYVFIIFIITKFGENFEEKFDICVFLNVLNKKVKVKKFE